MHGPTGCSGVHPFANILQSLGSLSPLKTSPQMHAGIHHGRVIPVPPEGVLTVPLAIVVLGKIALQTLHEPAQRLQGPGGVRTYQEVDMIGSNTVAEKG